MLIVSTENGERIILKDGDKASDNFQNILDIVAIISTETTTEKILALFGDTIPHTNEPAQIWVGDIARTIIMTLDSVSLSI